MSHDFAKARCHIQENVGEEYSEKVAAVIFGSPRCTRVDPISCDARGMLMVQTVRTAGVGVGQDPAPGSVGTNTAPAHQGASGVAGECLAGSWL